MKRFNGSAVKALRKARGLDRYDLAEVTQTSYMAVSKWEEGLTSSRVDTLPLLVAALGCNLDDLFEDVVTDEDEGERELVMSR